MGRFQGVCVLVLRGGGFFLSQTSNSNLGLQVIMNIGNKVIYGLLSPEMLVNLNKSHYI
jgi:hypothetical protein